MFCAPCQHTSYSTSFQFPFEVLALEGIRIQVRDLSGLTNGVHGECRTEVVGFLRLTNSSPVDRNPHINASIVLVWRASIFDKTHALVVVGSSAIPRSSWTHHYHHHPALVLIILLPP
jgi:hypothetical protein